MIRFFNNLKLGKKILLAPGVVLIFLCILGGGTYLSLSMQNDALDDIYNVRFKGYQVSATLLNDLSTVQGSIARVINWIAVGHDMTAVNALIKKQFATMEEDVRLTQEKLKSKNIGKKEKELYKTALERLLEYQKAAGKVLELAPNGVGNVYVYVADTKYDALNKIVSELHALENKLSQESYNQSMANFRYTVTLFLIVFVLAIVLTIVISIFVTRLILKPIHETIVVLRELAEGDLTRNIDMESRDEIGELVESVNTMRVKMGHAVGQALTIAGTLTDATSEEVASIEETSASLDEISSMTRRNAENTGEADKLMTAAKEAIKKVGDSMTELTKSMKDIAQASQQTQKVVKSIDEIAFQTNLLALNASVEAARAGEAGAGFAVVADEVRNLAMRATEAARGSSTFITDIVNKVKRGEELVNMTNTIFSDVASSSDKVVSIMKEISAASHEQSQGIEQINSAIAEINMATQQNATNAENLSTAMSIFKVDEQQYDDDDVTDQFDENGSSKPSDRLLLSSK